MSFFGCLLPERLRPKKPLTGEQRLKMFAQVEDGNPCLVAVFDMLNDWLEGNASVAFDHTRPEKERMLACERTAIVKALMEQIEMERHAAKKQELEKAKQSQ